MIEKNIDKKLANRISNQIWYKECLKGKFGRDVQICEGGSISASGFGPGGSKSASRYGPGGSKSAGVPNPLWHRHHTNDSFTTLTLQTNRIERPNLTLMMTSTQVVETSVTNTDNSPSQDYTHPDDQTTLLHVTPGFKPFTVYAN